MFNAFKKISEVFFHPESILQGITFDNDVVRYVIVKKSPKNTYKLVYYSTNVPWWISFFIPSLIRTDLSNIPVYIYQERIGDLDPDTWIEQNEKKIIPYGLPSDSVVCEYVFHNEILTSVCVTIKDRELLLDCIRNKFTPIMISAPLWNIGALYYEKLQKPFVLWKVMRNVSVLGFIEDGTVKNICNFWPTLDEFITNPQECINNGLPIVKSLAGNCAISVVVYSSDIELSIPSIDCTSEITILPVPDIDDIPNLYHEAYALACCKGTLINFIPYDRLQKTSKILNYWLKFINSLKIGLLSVLVMTILLLAGNRLIHYFSNSKQSELSELKNQSLTVNIALHHRDSLINVLKKTGKFSRKESTVTELLSDLQLVFPQGMWADEIDIDEKENEQWLVTITGYANETSLLGSFMSSIQKMRKFSDTRMVYSEQITLKNGAKVIQCRIETMWKD